MFTRERREAVKEWAGMETRYRSLLGGKGRSLTQLTLGSMIMEKDIGRERGGNMMEGAGRGGVSNL